MIKVTEIQGFENLDKMIKNLQYLDKNADIQGVLRTNGKRIVDSARNMAPHKTGALRKAIGFITRNDKRYRKTVLIGIRNDVKAYNKGGSYPGKYGNILQYDSFLGARKAVQFMNAAFVMNKQAVIEGIKKGIQAKIDKLINY